MDMIPNMLEKEYRVLDLVRKREIQDSMTRAVAKKLHVTENLISRLGLEKELNGHAGCVNCLEWNETGQVLASASDDIKIILWDPFRYEKKLVLRTGHGSNIFSVKFMPKSNDSLLVSGSADSTVHMHNLATKEPIFVCSCHTARVKRIATTPSTPFLFWTVAEDGLILQYDIRVPHTCNNDDNNPVLINLLNYVGYYAEGKSIAVNPKKPELIAIGANDPYIRMYDRRMIKLSRLPEMIGTRWETALNSIQRIEDGEVDNIPLGCAQYFIAGHHYPHFRKNNLSVTYLTFNSDGNELLVNMGGDQIYLFDINKPQGMTKRFFGSFSTKLSDSYDKDREQENGRINRNDASNISLVNKNVRNLPDYVEKLKRQANDAFEQQKYSLAINLYNEALSHCPTAAVLYANRAAAYMKRRWAGDIYAALRDCQTTLLLDPGHVKAHFRLARCLHGINRFDEAEKVIKNFQQKFPEYASNSACKALKMVIKEAIESGEDNDEGDHDVVILSREEEWRCNTIDYQSRYCGHCNVTTDIKEANFFGNNGRYIVAGSDDGSLFIWNRETTNIVRVLRGDNRIVNCLQPHPSTCLLATSGIDPVIRLWSPLPEDGTVNDRVVQDLEDAATENQIRMNSDPWDVMLMTLGHQFGSRLAERDDAGDDLYDQPIVEPLNCRPS